MNRKLAEHTLKHLGEMADRHGIETLNREQSTVLRAWATRGIVGNGGFKYFYEGNQSEHDPLEAATAFRALGFEAAARACEQSLSVFPGGRPPTDSDARDEILKKTDWDALDDLDRAVFRIKWEDLESAIGQYVVAHPDAFGIKPG